MNFQPGDTVKLKSGGEKMTVESVSDDLVTCVWFNDKKVDSYTFEPSTLKKYDPGNSGVVISNSY